MHAWGVAFATSFPARSAFALSLVSRSCRITCSVVQSKGWVKTSLHNGCSNRRLSLEVLRATSAHDNADKDGSDSELVVEMKGGIKAVSKGDWDALLSPDDSPFLEYDWLYALEESRCATVDAGWQPQHLVIRSKPPSSIIAAVPLYVKYHSMGEFIFDQEWAQASYGAGIPYYPKLLVGIPFTPAAGRRILLDPHVDESKMNIVRTTVAMFLRKLASDNNISSVHINFCSQDEVDAFKSAGFLHRKSLQYHWRNQDRQKQASRKDYQSPVGAAVVARGSDKGRLYTPGDHEDVSDDAVARSIKYQDFESYLGNFASKRRIKIRRERRAVYDDAGVTVTAYQGEDIKDEMLDTAYYIYKTTIDKMFYGRQYLNKAFFKELSQRFKRNIVLILAKRDNKVVAGTFNVVKAGRFYGRYWGAFETVKNLHFEACYYKAIEFCIENGLDVMEPGAGGGDFKFLRGFDPSIVNSCHFCTHPGLRAAVDNFLQDERKAIDEAEEYLTGRSALADRTNIQSDIQGAKEQEIDIKSRQDLP